MEGQRDARSGDALRPRLAAVGSVLPDARGGCQRWGQRPEPYTTLIDEVPGGAVYAAGYRNADVAADPYDNNTGQADQIRTSNGAHGIAVTAEWMLGDSLTARTIASPRRSEYEAGLDDDGFYDDLPEPGEADQSSVEAREQVPSCLPSTWLGISVNTIYGLTRLHRGIPRPRGVDSYGVILRS